MNISIVSACGLNNVIGKNGNMPWGYTMRTDLRRFQYITTGKVVIMGRKTFESIPGPLKNRKIIVLSRNISYNAGINAHKTVSSVQGALSEAKKCIDSNIALSSEVVIAGGAEIYRQFIPKADKIYLTKIQAPFPGDRFFPMFNMSKWQIIEDVDFPASAQDKYPFKFLTLIRKTSP